MFVVSQVVFADIGTGVSTTESESKADTDFKVSRMQLWVEGSGDFSVERIIGSIIGADDDTETRVIRSIISFTASTYIGLLMFGRQNDAGASILSRFNPFTNIKIAFCKTA